MIDLETKTYQYLAGTKPENDCLATSGDYDSLVDYLCHIMADDETLLGFRNILPGKKDFGCPSIMPLNTHDIHMLPVLAAVTHHAAFKADIVLLL